MNKRLLSLAASVALAAIGTFVILSYVRGAEERAVAGEETVEVLVVDEPIARGTPIEDLANRVSTVLVPAKVQAAGSLFTLDGLEGTVASVDLLPGEQVVASRFIQPETLAAEAKVDIPAGLLEVTIALAPERAVGGQPEPGDYVAVVASFDPFSTQSVEPGEEGDPDGFGGSSTQPSEDDPSTSTARTPNSTHVILHKVLITNIQAEQVARTTQTDDEFAGHDPAPTGKLLITLAVSAPELEEVVFAAEHGFVWLAREPIDAPETGTIIQTRATIYQ